MHSSIQSTKTISSSELETRRLLLDTLKQKILKLLDIIMFMCLPITITAARLKLGITFQAKKYVSHLTLTLFSSKNESSILFTYFESGSTDNTFQSGCLPGKSFMLNLEL